MNKKLLITMVLISITFGFGYRIAYGPLTNTKHYENTICDICGKKKYCAKVAAHYWNECGKEDIIENNQITVGSRYDRTFNICSRNCYDKLHYKYEIGGEYHKIYKDYTELFYRGIEGDLFGLYNKQIENDKRLQQTVPVVFEFKCQHCR